AWTQPQLDLWNLQDYDMSISGRLKNGHQSEHCGKRQRDGMTPIFPKFCLSDFYPFGLPAYPFLEECSGFELG
ncbi:MAG TPA: hypothetical protein V6D18_14685, partial [Thermosynechococcaceae cyanobacterium]